METKNKPELKVDLMKFELQVRIRNGNPVTISSSDFKKGSFPSFDSFKDFPFLKDKFHDYVEENKSLGTADSYVYYLQQLFNKLELPFANLDAQEGRKWFLLLPYIFAFDIDKGFQVLDIWMNHLNNHINALKKIDGPLKTFQNRKSALQAYINFLCEVRDTTPSDLSGSQQKVNNTIINNIKLQYSGITIPIEGPHGLIKSFLSRMRSEDRYPIGKNAVYYPARLLSKILGKEFTEIAVDCIRNITVFTTKKSYRLDEIAEITIDGKGRTFAIIKKTGNTFQVLNYENDVNNPLIAKSEADLSREHTRSIADILQDSTIIWQELRKLTSYINKQFNRPQQENPSKISKDIQKSYCNELPLMQTGLLTDLKSILGKTNFTLMQKSLNSSLNKHS